MLTELSIRNVVLISECTLTPPKGLCVLTGETGAGKSILLDALGLVLGMRAETRLVRGGAEQASVAATFSIEDNALALHTLDELGLEPAEELIIRRTLSSDGKSKCFANDVAIGVAALKTLGDTLVEIHGQHDGRGLLDPSTHREQLDAYAEAEALLAETSASYEAWKASKATLKLAQEEQQRLEQERDFRLHMQRELNALSPQAGEEETLANARTRMMQSEKLVQTLADALAELQAGKTAVGMISSAQRILSRSALNTEERFTNAIEALEKASNELAEAEHTLEKLREQTAYEPETLEAMEERLFALRAASRKYQVTVDELAPLLAQVNEVLAKTELHARQLVQLEQAVEMAQAVYYSAATTLSAARSKAALKLEKSVIAELQFLKMTATQFRVLIEPQPEVRWAAHGMDAVQFQAATNKGSALAPLHKIASGGELSRFMLAMKVALAKVKSTATLIFDEIDTGTGGAVADAIGQRLARLGESHQVLVVTHLPQVAACGDAHWRVSKQEKGKTTFTTVEVLSPKERHEELARMISGAEITTEARKAAERLLKVAK